MSYPRGRWCGEDILLLGSDILDVDIIFGCGDLGKIESDRRGGGETTGDVVVNTMNAT